MYIKIRKEFLGKKHKGKKKKKREKISRRIIYKKVENNFQLFVPELGQNAKHESVSREPRRGKFVEERKKLGHKGKE